MLRLGFRFSVRLRSLSGAEVNGVELSRAVRVASPSGEVRLWFMELWAQIICPSQKSWRRSRSGDLLLLYTKRLNIYLRPSIDTIYGL